MRLTIRVRITLWYTALIAAYLGIIATGGYGFLASVTLDNVDDLLAKSGAEVATAMEFERNAGATDSAAILSVVQGLKLPDVAITVLDQSTREANPAAPHPLPRNALPASVRRALGDSLEMSVRRAPRQPQLTTADVEGETVRILTLPYLLGHRPLIIGVAQAMIARDDMLAAARFALGGGLPALLLLGALGGYWLAGKSLAPVAAMSARAREIGARNLDERLPVGPGGDELAQLAGVLNDALARVQDAFNVQTRFVAEASHELRTPVAVISGETEHALARADRSAAELHESLTVIRAESLRLRSAIEDLFFLARADAGERPVRADRVDVMEVAAATLRAAQSRAPARRFDLVAIAGGDPEAGVVMGDAELIRRVLDNLVENAIKYSTPGSPVSIALARDTAMHVHVVDTGPGIAAHRRERLFERFYRGEDARTVADSGAGLGLAIARWIGRAHGGDVTLADAPGGGCDFCLTLPVTGRPVPAMAR